MNLSATPEDRQPAITVKPRQGKEGRSQEMLVCLFILFKEINCSERSSSDRIKAGKMGNETFLIQGNNFSSVRNKNDTRADLVVLADKDGSSEPPAKKARQWGGGVGWGGVGAPGAAVDSGAALPVWTHQV